MKINNKNDQSSSTLNRSRIYISLCGKHLEASTPYIFISEMLFLSRSCCLFPRWRSQICLIGICRTPVWSIRPFYVNPKFGNNFGEFEHHRNTCNVTKNDVTWKLCVWRHYYSRNNHLILFIYYTFLFEHKLRLYHYSWVISNFHPKPL